MLELRKDPVLKRWVIIASGRPVAHTEHRVSEEQRRGRQNCPFCTGAEAETPREVLRVPVAAGPDPEPWAVRVVPNKFPALASEGRLHKSGVGMYDRMTGIGAHEVFIETPLHDTAFAELSIEQLEKVLWAYRSRTDELSRDPRIKYVLVFKNNGRAAGASLEHPHSQLIATPVVPRRVQEELAGAESYYAYKERCVYCDILSQELAARARVCVEGKHFVLLTPFASRFPYEMLLLPKDHQADFTSAGADQLSDLARVLRDGCAAMGRQLDDPPYNFMIHTAPVSHTAREYYHWHIEIIPRLTRVAGFEWGSGFYINPVPPEDAARQLAGTLGQSGPKT
ncbi:MAG: galactose-1-phosphate uridylyltransferase [Candidatus Wallbacteria bacterium]|nr:galactose-1-phosphate uridylyltransferase [Candidatus Wallbacteria bacterium]